MTKVNVLPMRSWGNITQQETRISKIPSTEILVVILLFDEAHGRFTGEKFQQFACTKYTFLHFCSIFSVVEIRLINLCIQNCFNFPLLFSSFHVFCTFYTICFIYTYTSGTRYNKMVDIYLPQ